MYHSGAVGLLKNAHLLCYAANRTAQRISIRVTFRLYASRFGFLRALHLNIFEQPQNIRFLNNPAFLCFQRIDATPFPFSVIFPWRYPTHTNNHYF